MSEDITWITGIEVDKLLKGLSKTIKGFQQLESAEKATEKQSTKTEDALADLGDQVDQTRRQLKEANVEVSQLEAWGRIAGGPANELTGILGDLEAGVGALASPAGIATVAVGGLGAAGFAAAAGIFQAVDSADALMEELDELGAAHGLSEEALDRIDRAEDSMVALDVATKKASLSVAGEWAGAVKTATDTGTGFLEILDDLSGHLGEAVKAADPFISVMGKINDAAVMTNPAIWAFNRGVGWAFSEANERGAASAEKLTSAIEEQNEARKAADKRLKEANDLADEQFKIDERARRETKQRAKEEEKLSKAQEKRAQQELDRANKTADAIENQLTKALEGWQDANLTGEAKIRWAYERQRQQIDKMLDKLDELEAKGVDVEEARERATEALTESMNREDEDITKHHLDQLARRAQADGERAQDAMAQAEELGDRLIAIAEEEEAKRAWLDDQRKDAQSDLRDHAIDMANETLGAVTDALRDEASRLQQLADDAKAGQEQLNDELERLREQDAEARRDHLESIRESERSFRIDSKRAERDHLREIRKMERRAREASADEAAKIEAQIRQKKKGFERKKRRDAKDHARDLKRIDRQKRKSLSKGDKELLKSQRQNNKERGVDQREAARQAVKLTKAADTADIITAGARNAMDFASTYIVLSGYTMPPPAAVAAGAATAAAAVGVQKGIVEAVKATFHDGGIARHTDRMQPRPISGRRSDEVDATLLTREAVFNRSATARMGESNVHKVNAGGLIGPMNVGIYLGSELVGRAVVRELRTNATVRAEVQALAKNAVSGGRGSPYSRGR